MAELVGTAPGHAMSQAVARLRPATFCQIPAESEPELGTRQKRPTVAAMIHLAPSPARVHTPTKN